MTVRDIHAVTIQNIWIHCPYPNPAAKLRLFCFPYAGGGTLAFHSWPSLLPAEIELCAIKLPGREARLREAPYARLIPLVKILAETLTPYLDKPFAFYGHSMGAVIGFELIRQLRRQNAPTPTHLFVSGRNAPHMPDLFPPLHHLPDDEFLQKVQERYNSIPAVVWQNPELMQLFLPTLRADFTILETYPYKEERPLDTAISAFGGEQDRETNQEGLAGWQDLTVNGFRLNMLPGDHFFIQAERESLLQAFITDLAQFLS